MTIFIIDFIRSKQIFSQKSQQILIIQGKLNCRGLYHLKILLLLITQETQNNIMRLE